MKVLVTGANGYIGRHVVQNLILNGHEVIACDIKFSEEDKLENVIYKEFNIFNLPDGNLWEDLGSPDVCIHMAWRNGFQHNATTHIGDLSYHYNFLIRLMEDGLNHISVMGSMHEVGYWEGAIDEYTPCNPISMYAIAKDVLRKALMLYCDQNNLILQWLRCYYILGDDKKNNSIFCKLLTAAESGKKSFPFTSGKNKYDFIDVKDLSKMIVAASIQNEITGIINCCTGNPVSLADKVNEFIKKNKLDIELEYGAFPDRPYDSPCIYGDTKKIKAIMNKTK